MRPNAKLYENFEFQDAKKSNATEHNNNDDGAHDGTKSEHNIKYTQKTPLVTMKRVFNRK